MCKNLVPLFTIGGDIKSTTVEASLRHRGQVHPHSEVQDAEGLTHGHVRSGAARVHQPGGGSHRVRGVEQHVLDCTQYACSVNEGVVSHFLILAGLACLNGMTDEDFGNP